MRKIWIAAVLMLTVMMISASTVDASALRRGLRYDAWRDTIDAIKSAGSSSEAKPHDYTNRYTGTLMRRGAAVYTDIAEKAANMENAPSTDLFKYYQRLKNRDYLKVYGKLAEYGNLVQKAPGESNYRTATRARQRVYAYKPFTSRTYGKSVADVAMEEAPVVEETPVEESMTAVE